MQMALINFFAYDLLMNEETMKETGVEWNARFSVTFPAHKMVFNKIPTEEDAHPELGYPNVVPAPNNLGMMDGIMYEMKEEWVAKLDEYYQAPEEYQRKPVRVTKHDFTMVEAFTYIAPFDKTQKGLKPDKAMMKQFRKTKKSIQMLYFSRLMHTPTLD